MFFYSKIEKLHKKCESEKHIVEFTSIRAIVVSAYSTEEFGEVYLKAPRDAVPTPRQVLMIVKSFVP